MIAPPLFLALLFAAAPALAQPAGKAVPEAVPLNYVGKTSNNAVFITPAPAGTVKRLTKWTFYKATQTSSVGAYNTLSALIEVDCAAGTSQTVSGALLQGDVGGPTRIVQVTNNTGEKLPPKPGTVAEAVHRLACGTPNPQANPRFETLGQARAHTLSIVP